MSKMSCQEKVKINNFVKKVVFEICMQIAGLSLKSLFETSTLYSFQG